MKNKIKPIEIIKLVKKLPDVENHIHVWRGKQCITQEWLCGSFAGCCFEADTLEEAASEMIDYLYEHIGHDSLVGKIVTESGFPDLKKVEEYCNKNVDSNY